MARHGFIQDGSGSIWKVDLSFSLSMKKPSRIYRCHSGEISSISGSELNSLLLSGGVDGKTCIYDMNRRILVNFFQYSAGVTCLKWLPLDLDPTGVQVLTLFVTCPYLQSMLTLLMSNYQGLKFLRSILQRNICKHL